MRHTQWAASHIRARHMTRAGQRKRHLVFHHLSRRCSVLGPALFLPWLAEMAELAIHAVATALGILESAWPACAETVVARPQGRRIVCAYVWLRKNLR